MSKTTTLTSKGQLTLPKDIRDACRLVAGDRLVVTVRGDGVIELRPRRASVSDLVGLLEAPRSMSVEEMELAIREGATGE